MTNDRRLLAAIGVVALAIGVVGAALLFGGGGDAGDVEAATTSSSAEDADTDAETSTTSTTESTSTTEERSTSTRESRSSTTTEPSSTTSESTTTSEPTTTTEPTTTSTEATTTSTSTMTTEPTTTTTSAPTTTTLSLAEREAALRTAAEIVVDLDQPFDAKVPHLEDPEALRGFYTDTAPALQSFGDVTFPIGEVTVNGTDGSFVFDVALNGTVISLEPLTGEAVDVAGTWKVTTESICEAVRLAAGIACP